MSEDFVEDLISKFPSSPFSVPTLLWVKDVKLQDHIGEGEYIFSIGYGENASQADNNDQFFWVGDV